MMIDLLSPLLPGGTILSTTLFQRRSHQDPETEPTFETCPRCHSASGGPHVTDSKNPRQRFGQPAKLNSVLEACRALLHSSALPPRSDIPSRNHHKARRGGLIGLVSDLSANSQSHSIPRFTARGRVPGAFPSVGRAQTQPSSTHSPPSRSLGIIASVSIHSRSAHSFPLLVHLLLPTRL
jgi:hypothetical protein